MIMYQGALTFSTVAFPALTRHLPEVQRSAQEVQSRNKTLRDHSRFESLSRNRVSNVSFAVSSLGETFILAMMVGILEAMKAEDSSENNTRAFSVLIAFSGVRVSPNTGNSWHYTRTHSSIVCPAVVSA